MIDSNCQTCEGRGQILWGDLVSPCPECSDVSPAAGIKMERRAAIDLLAVAEEQAVLLDLAESVLASSMTPSTGVGAECCDTALLLLSTTRRLAGLLRAKLNDALAITC
jgi:hypothetical protein